MATIPAHSASEHPHNSLNLNLNLKFYSLALSCMPHITSISFLGVIWVFPLNRHDCYLYSSWVFFLPSRVDSLFVPKPVSTPKDRDIERVRGIVCSTKGLRTFVPAQNWLTDGVANAANQLSKLVSKMNGRIRIRISKKKTCAVGYCVVISKCAVKT